MIPILHSTYVETIAPRVGIPTNPICALCLQPCRPHPENSLIHCVELSEAHVDWPTDKPWMLLWFTDLVRSMLDTAAYIDLSCDLFFVWTESKMCVCEACFRRYIEQIEDSCNGTSYEPLVLAIRKKHGSQNDDNRRVDGAVLRDVQRDEMEYPQILGSITRRDGSDDPLASSTS